MNSCIYICKLGHTRNFPKKNIFNHSIYMMYLDLDELEELRKKFFLFSYNSFNAFSFYDKDHFKFINQKNEADTIAQEKVKYEKKKYEGKNTKERIETLIGELGLNFQLGRVQVLTNLRTFGYIFNPVSFYFCFDRQGKFQALFSEVNNTFGDQKMYLVKASEKEGNSYKSLQDKNYYISPFITHDNKLSWDFSIPDDNARIVIDSLKDGKIELRASLEGKRREFSNLRLFFLNIRYPMMPLLIIFWIHYQALRLFIKKVPFYKKKETDKKIISDIKNGKNL